MADEVTTPPVADAQTPAPENTAPAVVAENEKPAENLMNLEENNTEKVVKIDTVDNLMSMEEEKKTEETSSVPEEYEKFTTPEGWELNETEHKTYSELFRSLNLSQEQAQKLVDAYNERTSTRLKAHETAVERQIAEWTEAISKEPDFAEQRSYVRRTLTALNPTEEEKILLNNRQFTNNPVIWGMFAKLGKLLSEDSIGGGGTVPTPKADENPYKININ